ncbi:unnamed protein product [Spirodela intermedia]|uniref:Uncharacterized protein n=1 Tax=Spirodela intermedia TaxID=51605 RepID=A0A7I8JNA1_SPIIN|nr:unnamed protein product [Spirodela intermedia]CAA6671626.1 unnamed protein product [Spirodela intermedia]
MVKKRIDGLGIKSQAPDSKQKPIGTSISKPSGVKPQTAISSSTKTIVKTTSKTTAVRARAEKKVFSLPGQKYDPPEEREPLRIFYESLSKQIPSSEMAEFWMMEHGMLSADRAKRAYEKKQRRQQQLRTGTPIKSPKLERPESSKKPPVPKNGDIKAKKRVNYSDDDDDDEFIMKLKKTRS